MSDVGLTNAGGFVAGVIARPSTGVERETDGGWPADWIVQSEPEIVLANVDCREGLRALAPESVDVVVTSPPYNLGVRYGTYDDGGDRAGYLDWIHQIAEEVKFRLKPDGSFFLNIGSSPTNPWGPFEVIIRLRDLFALQNTIHWVKSIYIENESYGRKTALNVGHYKPINSERFLNDTHEYIFHLTKNGAVPLRRLAIGVPYKDGGNVARWKGGGSGLRCRGNSWYIPYRTIQSRANERPHPASFPPGIAEMCLKLHGLDKGELLVVDPFMGIGNTAIASRSLGARCIGFEIDPDYHAASMRLLRAG
jgi:site-specific DNA-methyltransferase (adenine-specific)